MNVLQDMRNHDPSVAEIQTRTVTSLQSLDQLGRRGSANHNIWDARETSARLA